MWALLVYYARGEQLIGSVMHEPYYLSLPLTWVALLKIYIFNTLIAFKMKSSSTWAILLPSAQGQSYTFMLSHHPFFEHFLESIAVILSLMCLSQNKINCGITVMLESFDIFTSSLLLNFRGAWHLCFAPQIRASEIPLYHIMLWTLQSCRYLCFILLLLCRYLFIACITIEYP